MIPLVSIIVPVYKTEQYLDRCVESLVNQTYKNLEIILVDDGSPDNCPAICDKWAQIDNRIKVIHKENGGVAAARNAGLSIIKGDYIGFVDSDDYIDFDMYQVLMGHALSTSADISICGYYQGDDTKIYSTFTKITHDEAKKRVLVGEYTYGVLWNKLYKRQCVQGINMPNLVCCEDLVYNFYAFNNAESIYKSDEKLYHYMDNENSIVRSSFSRSAFDALKAKQIIYNEVQSKELKNYAVKGLISTVFVLLSGIISNNLYLNEFDNLRNIIKEHSHSILKSPIISMRDKVKTIIILLSPSFFRFLIKKGKVKKDG